VILITLQFLLSQYSEGRKRKEKTRGGYKMKKIIVIGFSVFLSAGLMVGCTNSTQDKNPIRSEVKSVAVEVFGPHEGLNQEPVPLKFERIGENEVNVEMTAQITDIELTKVITTKHGYSTEKPPVHWLL